MAPNRNPAARLYAHVEVQHRPQETPPVEQGQAVVLSNIFCRLGRRVSGRGAVAWYTSIVGCGSVSFTYSLFTVTSYFSLRGATTRRATAPPFKHVIPRRSRRIRSPVLYAARAQRSGSCCERTSKGAKCVFAVRRKQNRADFARTTRGARP